MIILFSLSLQTQALSSSVAQKSEGSCRGHQHAPLCPWVVWMWFIGLVTFTLCCSLADYDFFHVCFKLVEPLNTRAVNNGEQGTVQAYFQVFNGVNAVMASDFVSKAAWMWLVSVGLTPHQAAEHPPLGQVQTHKGEPAAHNKPITPPSSPIRGHQCFPRGMCSNIKTIPKDQE